MLKPCLPMENREGLVVFVSIAASMGALNGCVENFSALAILQEAAVVSFGNKMSWQQSSCATL